LHLQKIGSKNSILHHRLELMSMEDPMTDLWCGTAWCSQTSYECSWNMETSIHSQSVVNPFSEPPSVSLLGAFTGYEQTLALNAFSGTGNAEIAIKRTFYWL
jgi:hypothetical protein